MSDTHYSESAEDTERQADPGDLFMGAAYADAPTADGSDAITGSPPRAGTTSPTHPTATAC